MSDSSGKAAALLRRACIARSWTSLDGKNLRAFDGICDHWRAHAHTLYAYTMAVRSVLIGATDQIWAL